MAKRTRTSKILNLCKTNSNFLKTTTSNLINKKQNETAVTIVNNQWGNNITRNSGSNSKVILWLQNNADNNINMTCTEDKSDEENANQKQNETAVTIVNNQRGNIRNNSGSTSKVKIWQQNNADNNINITCTEDKSDEENANLLLENSSSASEYDDTEKDKDWIASKKQPSFSSSFSNLVDDNNIMLMDQDDCNKSDETANVSSIQLGGIVVLFYFYILFFIHG